MARDRRELLHVMRRHDRWQARAGRRTRPIEEMKSSRPGRSSPAPASSSGEQLSIGHQARGRA